jgi:hypothetical protein
MSVLASVAFLRGFVLRLTSVSSLSAYQL